MGGAGTGRVIRSPGHHHHTACLREGEEGGTLEMFSFSPLGCTILEIFTFSFRTNIDHDNDSGCFRVMGEKGIYTLNISLSPRVSESDFKSNMSLHHLYTVRMKNSAEYIQVHLYCAGAEHGRPPQMLALALPSHWT